MLTPKQKYQGFKSVRLPKPQGPRRQPYTIMPPATDPNQDPMLVWLSADDLAKAKQEFPELIIREATADEVTAGVASSSEIFDAPPTP